MLAYKDLTRGTALPVSAQRVNAGLARARVIEDSRRPRVVSVTELEDKLKDRERRAAVLKHELVAPSVVRSLERAGTRRRWRQHEDCAIIVQHHRSAQTAKEVFYDAPHSCIAGACYFHSSVVRPKYQSSHGPIRLYDRH